MILSPTVRLLVSRLLSAGLVAALLVVRLTWPPRALDAVGPAALRDLTLALATAGVVLAVATRFGRSLVLRLHLPSLTSGEATVFGCALGLGILGYAVLGIGLAGALQPIAMCGLLILMALAAGLPRWPSREDLRRIGSVWGSSGPLTKVGTVMVAGIVLLSLLHALSPPWDYDGLMYHLTGPQIFLRAGRVLPYPANWYINAPFSLEMVFAVGMAFGDDVFPKLIHYASGVLLVGATYLAGRRWLGPRLGRLSAAVLLGIPVLPIWASFAYIDLAWSLFEFLALWAVVVWWRERSPRWLVLGGVMAGLALGSKYLGLMGYGLMGLTVLVESWRRGGMRTALREAVVFGGIALLIASPWYLKNLAWFGNPLFPLFGGGAGWSPERWARYAAYLDSFGTGRGLLDYLLLPWNVYAQHSSFGTVMNRIDVPALLFPLLLATPWIRRPPVLGFLLVQAVLRILLWSLGSQQIRFLFPVYPVLSIATAHVLGDLSQRIRRRPWHLLFPSLALGMVAVTLFYQVVVIHTYRPFPVAVGRESRRSFLGRIVRDFPATQFAQENLTGDQRVLLLGDGRGYYCPSVCQPDPDHFFWAGELAGQPSWRAIPGWLRSQGITHLALSIEDLDFLLQHDPQNLMREVLDDLLSLRRNGCLHEVFDDGWTSILAIDCDAGAPSSD
jgi:hypothetical protein